MLSVDCHEPPTMPTPPAAESARSALSLRRLALSFAPDREPASGPRRLRHASIPTVNIPAYSRITFRAGAASAR
jgi:hypothetical protein